MRNNRIVAGLMAVFLSVGMLTTGAFAYVEGDINSGAEASEDTSIVAEAEEQEDSAEVTAFESDTSTDTDDESEEQSEEETTTLTGTVNVSDHLNLRTGASTDDEVIGHLLPGTTVEIIGEEDGWYQVIVSEQTGYVCGDYLEIAESVTQTADESSEDATDSLDEETLLALYESLLQSADSSSESSSDSSLSLTPEGNLTLVDNITDAASGKQFITVCTKSGNYFYLIIDEDDEGESTVHFLNQVDEADLLALMDEDEAAEYEESLYGTDTEETEEDTSEEDTSTLEEEQEEPEEKSGGVNLLPVVLLVVLLAAGGGFFAYTQVMNKKKEEARPDPDADYVDETDGEDYDFQDTYDEDDEPV